MKGQSECVSVPKDIRTMRDATRPNTPHSRTIHDARLRDVLVTHSRSTR